MSVRTIRYYDTIGLLYPSAYSSSGRRLYQESDFLCLQQILSLKLIGLSLDEIKLLLANGSDDLEDILAQQKRLLKEKARRLSQVIQAIESAQKILQVNGQLELNQLIEIIEVMMMNIQNDWIAQFLNDDQQKTLVSNIQMQTLEAQKQTGQALQALFKDIQDNLQNDEEAFLSDIVSRWDRLMGDFAGSDDALIENLTLAYAHLGALDAPDTVKTWIGDIQGAAQFIQKARLRDGSD